MKSNMFGRTKTEETQASGKNVTERFKVIMEYYHGGKKELAIEMACKEMTSFIHYRIHKDFSSYMKYYEDMFNQGICGVLEGLKKYDPEISAPTTFFNFYIVHEISRFIDQFAKRTTSYYSSNIGIITRAIERLEISGKPYTEMDISLQTGLGLDTINYCLKLIDMTNEMYIESEDFIEAQISEKALSPEEEYLKKEESEVLQEAIQALGETDSKILRMKYGMDGTFPSGEIASDKDVANKMGIALDKVKRTRYSATRKLHNMPELRALFFDHYSTGEEDLDEGTVAFVPVKKAHQMMDDLDGVEIDF